MLRLFLIASLATSAVAGLGAQRANACGSWSLDDFELKTVARFQYSSVDVAGVGRVIRIDHNGTGESVHSYPGEGGGPLTPTVHSFVGAKLVRTKDGAEIGERTENGFVVYGRAYQVTVKEHRPPRNDVEGVYSKYPMFPIEVTRFDKKVVSGMMFLICDAPEGPVEPVDVQREILIRKVMIYIAATRTPQERDNVAAPPSTPSSSLKIER